MRSLCAFLALSLAAAAPVFAQPDAIHTSAYLKTLPNTAPPVIDQAEIVTLAALPLSCIDHPQDAPDHPHDYLWVHDSKRRTVDDYVKTRAFYGCFDWHSAVNSTWTLIYLLKQDPKMALAPIIRQRLTEHLAPTNIAGEVAFFADAKDTEGKTSSVPTATPESSKPTANSPPGTTLTPKSSLSTWSPSSNSSLKNTSSISRISPILSASAPTPALPSP